ncbi:MAG: WxcM-like domain-containing protein [Candidatus Paceibacterota bacterium]
MSYKIIETRTVSGTGDKNKQGSLTEIDLPKLTEGLMPNVQRVYFIVNKNSSEEIRGKHYHLGSSEILLCTSGQALVEVHSESKCEVVTINRDNAIFISAACWHAVRMDKRTTLLAIAENTVKETITVDELLDDCCCRLCGKLLSLKKEIEVELSK